MTEAGELRLRIDRVLPAPRGRVFRALTEPGELIRWWGPNGFTSPSVDFDPRAGGSYRIAMQPPEGDLFHLTGEFREVDPPARLAYTFVWEPADPDDRETLVSLSLEDRGDETGLSLEQGPFLTDARLALHDQGWSDSLDKLQRHLAGEG